ncbi:class I SAM-dependent methyltransferase [Nocardioides piscis]|uniref:Class I SAM-dependent methyltransferase n=1 Tax=Nocardioides piscis TaxID=2714938 RepID=A0A6G7YF28_9ACTN|nr:methyltransferase domain-containing protein [Nocardioides piscis]QIK75217.1 class I SAM-dependent methyltransferase [Nocardioides piscis]
MAELQEADYGEGRDYAYGSPHLTHAGLGRRIEAELRDLVAAIVSERGECRVVEVGAGHGPMTAHMLAAGASVTVTEMSEPSARVLASTYGDRDDVRVVHDPDGARTPDLVAQGCDLLVFIGVLHHIPDYLTEVGRLVEAMPEGGSFYCTMDPTFYPTRPRGHHAAERASYLLWRVAQGNLRRGIATRWRRVRGVWDETLNSDMVEYHTVRQGVDQEALAALLRQYFTDVDLRIYWSTQGGAFQRLGERFGWTSTFGITARGRTGRG